MAYLKLVYLLLLANLMNLVTTKAQEEDHGFSGYYCSENQTTPNSAYHLNVKTLLSYLSSNATAGNKSLYNATVARRNHSETAYGMFVCWGDVPPRLCSRCVQYVTNEILSNTYQNCSLSKDAVIQYRDCMIRFSNTSFFATADLSSPSGSCVPFIASNQTKLLSLFSKTINELADEAANSGIGAKKYATKQVRISGFQTLYWEAQCTPDLSPQDCRKCLNVTITSAQQICEEGLGEYDTRNCIIKYDLYPFYRPSTASAPTELVPVTNLSKTDSQNPSYLSHNCSTNQTMITTDTVFLSNLKTLLSSLSSNAAIKTGFYKNTIHTVSGLFVCRGDLSPSLCQQCVLTATQRISSECPSSKEAIIWYDHCLLRYSPLSSLSNVDTTPSYHQFNIVNTSNPTQQQSFFPWALANALSQVEMDTEEGPVKNYEVKSVELNDNQTLYTLVQCSQDLSNGDCRTCLDNIFKYEIPWCCLASPEGKVLYPSCYMMFGLSQFYGDADKVEAFKPPSPSSTTKGNKEGKSQIIILIVVLVVVSMVLLSFCCYLQRRKARMSSYKTLFRKNFGHESNTLEGYQFDLTTIKAATDNFSYENKIGKGGFGVVYKGILSDGRHIAVKRLSTRSKQGFCLEEEEKILIYEYMSNGSLDYHLFGTHQQKLNWSERYKIIEETALRILYLHEYSRLKIIHSNILLDENMNPKISDFGMARIVELDQDRENTNRIVGTYGYMSPEYAMLGQFSDKSDIFSFGIMILEIITGKKNNSYKSYDDVESLMNFVWRRWKDQIPLSILDSNIKENYFQIEVFKCIHIGLLCVQENPNDRPTMATIISYLNSDSLELPSPQEPVFFLHSLRMDQEIVTQQESSSSQAAKNSTVFSINEMSISKFYPR